MSITVRQVDILKAIIKEFMKTADAVGSLTLPDKYKLGISPATLRAEMTDLVQQGYLYKEHSSSGRLPTTLGLRFFLDEILEEEKVDKTKETNLKEKLFQNRFNKSVFIKESVKALSNMTHEVALSLVDDVIYIAGISQLLSYSEFEDLDLLQNSLDIIESESLLQSIFNKYKNNNTLRTLIGDEIGIDSLNQCGIVFSPYKFFRGAKGYIAVFGPRRMRYARIIPMVRNISNFIQESISGWE
jgi:heat-inducible transcriptional repressor